MLSDGLRPSQGAMGLWITARDFESGGNTRLPREEVIAPEWGERSYLAHLADHVAQAPDALALADGTRRLSRADLHADICRLGAALCTLGWPAGAVGVLLPNDARYVVAKLGVLAAGRPCMLLSLQVPALLLARVVDDAALVGVVTCADLAARLPVGLAWLDADAVLAGAFRMETAPAEAEPVSPDAPAFIVSTSGTTGVPKAVVRTQRAMLSNHAHRIRDIGLGPHDRVASLGTPSSAGALSHRLYTLSGGAALAVLDPADHGLSGVLAQMGALGITVLHATPLVARALAGLPLARQGFASLRLVMLGGDMLLHADLAVLRRALPEGCQVHYGFGLSEAARIASWFVPADDRRDPVRVASGTLRPGVAVMLLDEAGEPVPPGEAGALVVSTPYAAIGDWSGGRVMPARFEADPRHPGRRVVHTGDVARLGPDGVLVVLGRRDRMIKLGGHRVEPVAIELAMRSVPGVADAAILALPDGGQVRLIGFLVPGPHSSHESGAAAAEVLVREVRAALRAMLPAFMVPAQLTPVAAVPLTAAGKRDEAALAALANG